MNAGRADGLRQAFRKSFPLLEGARRVGDPIAVLPTLYHLVWTARPGGRPGLRSPVRLVPGGGERMTVSRPQVLRAGDDILLGGELHTIQAVSATVVRLANVVGTVSAVPLAEVLASPGFALVSSARSPAPLPPSGLLDGIPEAEAEHARWWERHIAGARRPARNTEPVVRPRSSRGRRHPRTAAAIIGVETSQELKCQAATED